MEFLKCKNHVDIVVNSLERGAKSDVFHLLFTFVFGAGAMCAAFSFPCFSYLAQHR